jgi:uncharacterized protein (DUF1697 family)
MPRQVALLRGINVGGSKKVAMATLREVFAGLGLSEIKTYVNSGNVVFSGRKASVVKLERAIADEFGFEVPVVIRTRDEIADVVAANPLQAVATNPARYLVLFADREIDPERTSHLDLDALAPEVFALRGREAYLWLPNGVQSSKLVRGTSDKRLGVMVTGRNWRTVEQLLALADAAG